MTKRICFRITHEGNAYGMSIDLELKDDSTYDPANADIDKDGLMELIGLDPALLHVELISPEQFDAEFDQEDLEEVNA